MSALRWKVVTLPSGFIPSIVTDTTNEAEEIHITNVAGFSRTDRQDLDNAAQIVAEHNAHDALCEALDECIVVLKAIGRGSLKARTLAMEQLPKAQAALRLTNDRA